MVLHLDLSCVYSEKKISQSTRNPNFWVTTMPMEMQKDQFEVRAFGSCFSINTRVASVRRAEHDVCTFWIVQSPRMGPLDHFLSTFFGMQGNRLRIFRDLVSCTWLTSRNSSGQDTAAVVELERGQPWISAVHSGVLKWLWYDRSQLQRWTKEILQKTLLWFVVLFLR